MKRPGKKPVCWCGGGYERIENAPFPLPDGRPQFRCTRCGNTWTEGRDGGESLRALEHRSKFEPAYVRDTEFVESCVKLIEHVEASWFRTDLRARIPDGRRQTIKDRRTARAVRLLAHWYLTRKEAERDARQPLRRRKTV